MTRRKTTEARIRVTAENGDRFTIIKTTNYNWTPAGGGVWIEGTYAVVTTDGNAVIPNEAGGWKIFNSPISNNNPNFVIAYEFAPANKNDSV